MARKERQDGTSHQESHGHEQQRRHQQHRLFGESPADGGQQGHKDEKQVSFMGVREGHGKNVSGNQAAEFSMLTTSGLILARLQGCPSRAGIARASSLLPDLPA